MRQPELSSRLPICALVAIALFSTTCKKQTPPRATEAAQTLLAELGPEGAKALNTGDEECSGPYEQPFLEHPTEVLPSALVDGEINTAIVVRRKMRCVPVWDNDEGWVKQELALRTYGFPTDHTQPIDQACEKEEEDAGECVSNLTWSAPGPTFLMLKSEDGTDNGTRFNMSLYNRLDPAGNQKGCNDYDSKDTADPDNGTTGVMPNCFHGDNDTNYHFHGFHISPQGHQDNVGVLIKPYDPALGEEGAEISHADMGGMDMEAAHGEKSIPVNGRFDYALDPIPDNQAEGTHWYHAHKHGSTALQLLNGLSGTFLLFGEFDGWLYEQYGIDPFNGEERNRFDRLLVVQQIGQNLPFNVDAKNNARPQYPLVNGQANPIVEMQPGEVQRWRFVSATMTTSSQLEVNFETSNPNAPRPEIRQIAKDGVQFAPANYERQPLLTPVDGAEGPGIDLSPGYRVDLLVKAPMEPGDYYMTHEVIAEDLDEGLLEAITEQNASIRDALGLSGFTGSPLVTVRVAGQDKVMEFPAVEDWPDLPSWLDDIEVDANKIPEPVVYSMKGRGNRSKIFFEINDAQYRSNCVEPGQTLKLGESIAWELGNDSTIAHPFHIHVNPFQVLQQQGEPGGPEVFDAPYPWMDTLNIPTTYKALFACEGEGDDRVCEEFLPYGACSRTCSAAESECKQPCDTERDDCRGECDEDRDACYEEEGCEEEYATCASPCTEANDACHAGCRESDEQCADECDAVEAECLVDAGCAATRAVCREPCDDARTTCRTECDKDRDECYAERQCNETATTCTEECVSACGDDCEVQDVNGTALIYQHPVDYTGAFVQHCHILGHEDRGMMLNVQTVCVDEAGIEYFGVPQPDTDECTNTRVDALELCE